MKRDVIGFAVFGLLLLLVGGVMGYRFGADRYAAWKVRADLVLADSARIATEHAALVYEAEVLRRSVATYADRVARQDARVAVAHRTADSLKREVLAYRDSVHARADSVVPSAKLDDALAVIAEQDTVIAAQQDAIALRDRQIQAGAELRAAVAQDRDLWKGRAGELERVLGDLKPPSRPRVLGILPVPSPTVAFLAGAVVTLVVVR